MPQSDHYALLGVPRDATEMEIRSAYGRAALAQQVSGSTANAAALKEALDVLTDPDRRRAYDAELASSGRGDVVGAGAIKTPDTSAAGGAPARARMSGPLGVLVGIVRRFPILAAVLVFAAVGYLFRDYLSTNVSQLKVGDCFDLPAGGATAATVKDVQHHPCTDTHDAEMVFIGDVPNTAGAYPGKTAFESFVKAQCVPAYQTYTGRDFNTDQTYDMSFLFPLSDGWAKGDHTVQCFAVRVDGHSFKGTIKTTP